MRAVEPDYRDLRLGKDEASRGGTRSADTLHRAVEPTITRFLAGIAGWTGRDRTNPRVSSSPTPTSMRARRRPTAATLRPLRNPDKRNNQDEDNGGSKKDIVQSHHRGLGIHRVIE